MHKQYFPVCPVRGPIDPPAPYSHFSKGAIPQKCGQCRYLFEGGCTRYLSEVGHYLNLDHGYCGIAGPTDPVVYQDQYITSKVEVPRKCVSCSYLQFERVRGFICGKDKHVWGRFPRGLDWGTWEPGMVYLQLPLPKVTTRDLALHARKNDLIEFIKEHRRWNPGLSMQVAREDFQYFRILIEQAESQRNT